MIRHHKYKHFLPDSVGSVSGNKAQKDKGSGFFCFDCVYVTRDTRVAAGKTAF